MHQYLPILLRVLVTIMMIGMGVALTLNDFKELRSRGKAVLLGLSIQILALPILALAITQILPLSYEMALGLFLVACCPGGPLSNIFTYLSKGNLALSITLTAIVSILTIVTLPLYLNWYIQFALDSSQSKIAFSMGSTMITMTSLMLLPIICGMALRHYFPKLIKIFDAIIKLTMLVAVPIAMYLAIDSLLDLENIADHLFFTIVGALMLNIVTIIFSFLLSSNLKIGKPQIITITFEGGIQNYMVGMTLAVSPLIFDSILISVPAIIYGFTFLFSAIVLWRLFIVWKSPNPDQN